MIEPRDTSYPRDLKYYISTGRTGAIYTLRVEFTDLNFQGKPQRFDRHVITMTTDLDASIDRARYHIERNAPECLDGLDLSRIPSLRKITRHEIDHNVIQFGKKHAGETVAEVAKNDRGYLIWAAENVTGSKHTKTIEIIREVVAEELAERAEAARQRELAREAREQAEVERRANLAHVGTIGERREFTVTYTGTVCFDTDFGTTALHFLRDDEGNELVWRTTKALHDEKTYERAERGQRLTVRATVKAHGEYKGRKQTELARLAVVVWRR